MFLHIELHEDGSIHDQPRETRLAILPPRAFQFFFIDGLRGESAGEEKRSDHEISETCHARSITLGRTPKIRGASLVQIALGIYMLAMQADVNWVYWYREGGGAPKSALYGIWDVDQLSINGEARPAVLNDYDRRWRRVIFDAPDSMAFQRTDDSFAHYGAAIDEYKHTLALTMERSKKWRADFAFERPSPDELILDGEMDGYKIRMKLQLVNLDTFRLLNSGFRWVRPSDY